MTSLFRPLLSSLLCCVIAFGQLPALMHVVSCHDHAHCQRVGSPKVSEEVCAHGCHHFADINVSDAKVAKLAVEESPTIPWHDSEDCAVCQSLANPVGFVGHFELQLVQLGLCELASIYADLCLVEASIAIPQPRGPPVVIG